MKTVQKLANKALEMKKKGLTEKDIADELHLSMDTVTWLLTKKGREEIPCADVRIGWRSVGVYPHRTRMISAIMADIAVEELGEEGADTVVAIANNGVSLATFMAEEIGLELSIFRNLQDDKSKGTFSSNFAGLKGKKVIVVDDVLGTGETIKGAIANLKKEGAKPVLCMVIVNKTGDDTIAGVKLRGLIRAAIVE
jgi:orotate phosphoribosyltransferase